MRKNDKVYRMALLALLAALIALFWYGIGTINLGFIAITLSCLPVIIGTLALGFRSGLILALCFATITFIEGAARPAGVVAPIFGAHILWGAALCYIPRILVPVTVHLLHKAVGKKKNKALLAVPAAAGSLTNTVFFLGFILLMYALIGIESPELLGLLGTAVLVGGLPEAAVAAIVCPPVIFALRKARLIEE